eukprot:TRINITY_DN10879_c0_g1_i7.p1 TRINITY_DN10879_c0_g1~~TRINITY_DN10879_c0_g1_i7.p1  ORF type:complete len:263 (-),score=26.07 TRINITY_DN10879_c0_g1_i7:47-733(-)
MKTSCVILVSLAVLVGAQNFFNIDFPNFMTQLDVPSSGSVSVSRASSTPDGMQVSTYQVGGGQATAVAAGPEGQISCSSPSGPTGTAVVCSGDLPKNVTGAVVLYSKVKGNSWCLKVLEDKNIVLGECSGTHLWYFDEAFGLRPVQTQSCAAINDSPTLNYFVGNVYLEEKECDDAKWIFDDYQLKSWEDPTQCLTVCVSPEDGCNEFAGISLSTQRQGESLLDSTFS